MTTWQVYPGELLRIFQRAMVAILPAIEDAKIPWREPDNFDDWDAIASVLFREIVTRSLRWSLPTAEMDSVSFPPYDSAISEYTGQSFMFLRETEESIRPAVFRTLVTRDEPFDHAEWVRIGRTGKALAEGHLILPLRSCEAGFMHWRDGAWTSLNGPLVVSL